MTKTRFSRTFKVLKLDSWNSTIFKGFQDAYEPCSNQISTTGDEDIS